MICPKCGYVMGPFDVECPRCKRLEKLQQEKQEQESQQPNQNSQQETTPSTSENTPMPYTNADNRTQRLLKISSVFAIVMLVANLSLVAYMHMKFNAKQRDMEFAWSTAKEVILQHLKAPATASFGNQTPEKCVELTGQNTCTVRGWVDSENGFGAFIRTEWVVSMHKEEGVWKPDSINLSD